MADKESVQLVASEAPQPPQPPQPPLPLHHFPTTLSPIGQIPAEILALVFHDIYSSTDRRQESATAHALLSVLLVCRHWQTVVITNPILWTTIWTGAPRVRIVNGYTLYEPVAEWLPFVEVQLKRSGANLPLNIVIHPRAEMSVVAQALQSHITRLASITFLSGGATSSHRTGDDLLFQHRMPNLHTVSDSNSSQIQRGTIDAPLLRHWLCKHQILWTPAQAPLPPLITLEACVWDGDHENKSLDVLFGCRDTLQLITLTVGKNGHRKPFAYVIPPDLVFPRTHTLHLDQWSNASAELLYQLSFPALEELTLGSGSQNTISAIPPSPRNFPRPFSQLRRLIWCGSGAREARALGKLLQVAPELEVLGDWNEVNEWGLEPRYFNDDSHVGSWLLGALKVPAHLPIDTFCTKLLQLHVQRARPSELDEVTSEPGRSKLERVSVEVLQLRETVADTDMNVPKIIDTLGARGVRLQFRELV